PGLLDDLGAAWDIRIGASLPGGFVGYLAEAVTADDRPAVVKVAIPDGLSGVGPFASELEAVRLGNTVADTSYVELLHFDPERRAVLLERLGRPLGQLGLTVE